MSALFHFTSLQFIYFYLFLKKSVYFFFKFEIENGNEENLSAIEKNQNNSFKYQSRFEK